MLTSKFIRENMELVKANLKKRNNEVDLDFFLKLENRRLEFIRWGEEKKSRRNRVSKEIGLEKYTTEKDKLKEEMRRIGDEIRKNDQELNSIQNEIDQICYSLPNILEEDVPSGKNEDDNLLVRSVGKKPNFDFIPKDHVDLLRARDWADFERAAKISGARFTILKKEMVRLERALIHFLLDQNISAGYTELHPPSMVKARCLWGTGQLPKFREDLFSVRKESKKEERKDQSREDLYLIPTAEVPLTNLHADEILPIEELPKCYTAYTSCFRSEAGAAGKDTKGLIRLHEFGKVELVHLTTPEDSPKALEEMLKQAESILKLLKLPYQVLLLCSVDTGFSARKCYDLEVWLPGQQAYREVSSCSNCGEFQSIRAQIRFRNKNEKPRFVHTLNGSSLPIGRTLVAILENYQLADGSIQIPEALVPYFGNERIE